MNMELYISLAAMIISLLIFVASKKKFPTPAKKSATESVEYTAEEKLAMAKELKQRSIDDETNSKYYELLGYLARLEHFSLGVNTGIYDAKTAERAGTAFLVSLRKKLLPVIELQEKRGNHNSDKRIEYYKEFRMLTERVAKYE